MQAHLLVVDDHPLLRDALRLTLEAEGYRVSTASDGFAALAAVAAERPDIVLTDIQMPGMDGWELRRHLLATAPSLPVIVMSSDPGIVPLAPMHRADACMVKPFDIDDLLCVIERLTRAAAA